MSRYCLALVVSFVLLSVTVYAGGTDCSGPLGLNPYFHGAWRGVYDLPPDGSGGMHYTEKASHVLMCAPVEGSSSVTINVMTYSANKYSLSGDVGYAGWFYLAGNWQSETVTLAALTKTCTVSNGSCDGPCYIYEKRPYHQKYKVWAREVPVHSQQVWIYCEPCHVQLATLEGSPSLSYETDAKNEYVDPKKTSTDACNYHSY
jgi:hypothetical protein